MLVRDGIAGLAGIFCFSVSDLVGFLTRMDTDLETWTDTDWLADESD